MIYLAPSSLTPVTSRHATVGEINPLKQCQPAGVIGGDGEKLRGCPARFALLSGLELGVGKPIEHVGHGRAAVTRQTETIGRFGVSPQRTVRQPGEVKHLRRFFARRKGVSPKVLVRSPGHAAAG